MCRFVAYHGAPVSMAALITEPVNSLIHQSFHSNEREEPLNGDGFGLAWYERDAGDNPGLFRSISPAWSNRNLHELARMTVSPCILGHVRAASEGSSVTEPNCHPFVHGRFAFMHNGELAGFRAIRRKILAELSDEAFDLISGTTDSEHLFALFLDRLREQETTDRAEALALALEQSLTLALRMAISHLPDARSYLNIAVSDGRFIAATRYASEAGSAESLHLHAGQRYSCEAGICKMEHPGPDQGSVIISSEVLSDDPGWETVPEGHVVLVDERSHAQIRPLRLDL